MAKPLNSAYRQATFTIAVNEIKQLPPDDGIEVAFAGRSNAGKSSAINTLTGIKSLARTSKTPGRTQQIVYFTLDEHRHLVDLPGYGYAKVPLKIKQHWHTLMEGYFSKRKSLKGLVLVMDIRHALREFDLQMLDWCGANGVAVHILLTKADKLSKGAAAGELQKVRNVLKREGFDNAEAQVFSSLKAQGTETVLKKLNTWFEIDLSKDSEKSDA